MADPSTAIAGRNSADSLSKIKQEKEEQHSQLGFQPPMEPEMQTIYDVKYEPLGEESGEPQFMKSIEELGSFTAAFDAFKRKFDELQKHLDFINRAIDTELGDPRRRKKLVENGLAPIPPLENGETGAKSSKSEIQHLCETMCSRGVRKYISTHLQDVPKLKGEVPAALRLAPRPGKLVLECIGRFYLQGIRAYDKDSPMIPARLASVLTLELFLLMIGTCGGEIDIEDSLKEEAETGANNWKKRLVSEGGLGKASETDARGLLFFIGSFGIPKAFKDEDIGNLLWLCNLKETSEALKGSSELVARIPDIVDAMVKSGMQVAGIDIAVSFGLEEKFPPQSILNSFLKECKEAYDRAKRGARNDPKALRYANEKHLASLKSAVKCLEDHNIDPVKVLDGVVIKEKITELEKEIADLDKKFRDRGIPKRKLDETGSSSRGNNQGMKRSRYPVKEYHGNGFNGQRAIHKDGLMHNSYENAMPGRVNTYSSVTYGSNVGSWPDNSVGPVIGGPGLLHGAGARGNVVTGSGLPSPTPSSYSGASLVDAGGNKSLQIMSNSNSAYGWHGVDPSYIERSIGQNSVGQSTAQRVANLIAQSQSIESFAGRLDYVTPASNQTSGTDLYRFADVVAERDPYGSSTRPGTVPSNAPARHPSYL